MTTEPPPTPSSSNPWRRTLRTAVAALLVECGYQSADNMALETLLEIVQAYIWEAGRSSGAYAELAGRTRVMPSDVVMSLVEMGVDFTKLPGHAKRENKSLILPPLQAPNPPQAKILQVGDKRKHPGHIPDHLPSFPDPHTYIKTPCVRQPANEYQLVREKAASQKRDVEVGLTRFIAKTGATHSLFKDDKSSFPLIACKPSALPYMSALLPMDSEVSSQDGSELETGSGHHQSSAPGLRVNEEGPNPDAQLDADAIDNPYLIPAKITKKKWAR
ncbi:transcription initiation factor TFIID subunit 8 [Aplysia californica]|uniref:Transcription initiation factor TFIID subunit 8 n=1 Tax=Aplysia californica TaxID=6500 RepID=A0ABM0JMA2_APLCA|nr:transcription initiation factor TFIID subunit 8 [Aplysia californica]